MNQWSGIGNLMNTPTSFVNDSGKDICSFKLSVNRPRTQSDDTYSDTVPIRAEGRIAALCREYLTKGRKIGVVGKLRTYYFTDSEGETHSGFYVKPDDVTFLPSGSEKESRLGDIHSDDGVIHQSFDFDRWR